MSSLILFPCFKQAEVYGLFEGFSLCVSYLLSLHCGSNPSLHSLHLFTFLTQLQLFWPLCCSSSMPGCSWLMVCILLFDFLLFPGMIFSPDIMTTSFLPLNLLQWKLLNGTLLKAIYFCKLLPYLTPCSTFQASHSNKLNNLLFILFVVYISLCSSTMKAPWGRSLVFFWYISKA